MEGKENNSATHAAFVFLRAAEHADVIGWILIVWPLSFFVYQELYHEGIHQLTFIEAILYGLPALSLPLLGYLVKSLAIDRKKISSTQQNLQNIIDNMGDILMIVDRDKTIIFGNPILKQYFGNIIGKKCFDVFKNGDGCSSVCPGKKCIEANKTMRGKSTITLKNGQKRSFDIHFSPFRDNRGEYIGTIEIWRDVTLQLQLEQKLKKQALTDSLTKLQNSRSFFMNFPADIKRSLRQKYPLALVMVDIDRFKQYNDTFGHISGDKVLRDLGAIISKHIRNNVDSGFRYGGDEFILVLPYLGEDKAKNAGGNRIHSHGS